MQLFKKSIVSFNKNNNTYLLTIEKVPGTYNARFVSLVHTITITKMVWWWLPHFLLPDHSKIPGQNKEQMWSIALSVQPGLLLDFHMPDSFSCFTWKLLSHAERSFLTTQIPHPVPFQLYTPPIFSNLICSIFFTWSTYSDL